MSKFGLKHATVLAREGANIELVSHNATGTGWDYRPCAIESGVLVYPHPTEPTGTVDAPDGRHYRVSVDLEADMAAYEQARQADDVAAFAQLDQVGCPGCTDNASEEGSGAS